MARDYYCVQHTDRRQLGANLDSNVASCFNANFIAVGAAVVRIGHTGIKRMIL